MSDNKPREDISEISEIAVFDVTQASRNFLAAVGWGGLAGTLAVSIPLLIAGLLRNEGAEILLGVFMIGMLAMLFTLVGMLLIGLPVTVLLRAIGAEHHIAYAVIGATSGFIAMAALFEAHRMHAPEMLLFPGAGAVAGFAAAWRWGRWRDALLVFRMRKAAENELIAGPATACDTAKPSNPIHDLIH